MRVQILETIYPKQWLDTNRLLLQRVLIIVGLFVLSAVIAYKVPSNYFKFFFALPVVVIGGLVVLKVRPLGVVAIVGTIIIPVSGPSGVNATMGLVALMLGLWALDKFITKDKTLTWIRSSTILPLLMFVLLGCITIGIGLLDWYITFDSAPLGAQLGTLGIYLLSATAFLLVAHYMRDLRWLQLMVWFFLALGALYMVGAFVRPIEQLIRPFYLLVDNGSLFWAWIVTLAFSQALFNRDLHPLWRLGLTVLVVATLYIAFVERNGWKSGWVPAIISLLTILAFRLWQLSLTLSPFAILPASYVIGQTIATDEYSYGTRISAWETVIEIANVNPILGIGFANYNWFSVWFPIQGMNRFEKFQVRFNSHSQYIDIYAQQGVVGLALFFWFFGQVAWVAWRLRNAEMSYFARAYVYGAMGGVAATLMAAFLGDWVLPFFYNVGMYGFRSSVLSWLFLGGLVAIEQGLRDKDKGVRMVRTG